MKERAGINKYSLPILYNMEFMKLKYQIVGLLTLILLLFSTIGCTEKQKAVSTSTNKTGYELAVTHQDTIEVTHLVNLFMNYLEDGNYAYASAMLYKGDPNDVFGEYLPLDNDELQEKISFFKQFPIHSHRIDYIKFHEAYDNEVKCTAIFQEAHDGMPEISTVFYFKPVDYLGSWLLCLMDSDKGYK